MTTASISQESSDAGSESEPERGEPDPRAPEASDSPQGSATERDQRIREEAYRRSQARGDRQPDPMRDWLDAEAEIDRQDRSR